jgi:hypothetical protein
MAKLVKLINENLTPFGLFIYNIIPVWRWDSLFGGYAIRGIVKKNGGFYVGYIAEAYTHYWPWMKMFPCWRVIWFLPFGVRRHMKYIG